MCALLLGLVGTAAGIGMTVYMVKQMKDNNDQAQNNWVLGPEA